MPSIALPGGRAFSSVFGLLMVGTAAVGSHGPAMVLGVAAVVAVGFGTVVRASATSAVLLVVATILVSNQSHVLAALAGLCAAAYLVCRHAASGPAVVSWPTVIAAVGFTLAGLVATLFPLRLPWLPLAAPLAVLAIYVLAIRPFLS